jgi:hypothetical protein
MRHASIPARVDPLEDAGALGPVQKLGHRARNEAERIREVTYTHGVSRRRRLDDEQEQILARSQARYAYGSFRDRMKPSQGEPERGRTLQLLSFGGFAGRGHADIVGRLARPAVSRLSSGRMGRSTRTSVARGHE